MAAFFTILRTWLQHSHNKRLYTNDYLICLALMLHVVLTITVQCMAPVVDETFQNLTGSGNGTVTVSSLPLASSAKFLKYQFATLYLVWTALWTVKLASLSFFWRLFTSVQTNARLFWRIMCGITVITWIVCLLLQGFACLPLLETFRLSKHYSFRGNVVDCL